MRKVLYLVCVILTATLLLSGCNGTVNNQQIFRLDDNNAPQAPGNNPGLFGRVTFERPVQLADGSLDFTNINELPARGITVQFRDQNNVVLARASTNNQGFYNLNVSGTLNGNLEILAQSLDGSITVFDVQRGANVVGRGVFPVANTRTPAELNVVATTGFEDGVGFTGERVAGPFSIFDVTVTSVEFALTNLGLPPGTTFPPLRIEWDTASDDAFFSFSDPDGQTLVLGGLEDVNTHEFDVGIIAHETGHFVLANLSHTDSLGGAHFVGVAHEPKLTWDEGFASFWMAIVTGNTTLLDSNGLLQADGTFLLDAEDNSLANDTNPGWFSEISICCILFDIFDDVGEQGLDNVALGLGPIFQIIRSNAFNTTTAFVTLFTFVDTLQDTFGAIGGLNTILAQAQLQPVQDELGTGETLVSSIDGDPDDVPIYKPLVIDDVNGPTLFQTRARTINGDVVNNVAVAHRLFLFTGNGQTVQVATAAGANDVDFFVIEDGARLVAQAFTPGVGVEAATFATIPGVRYAVCVIANNDPGATFQAAVSVTTVP